MNQTLPCLLLVEDNEDDVFLFRRALRQAQLACALHVAEDGQQALDYLGGTGRYADRGQFPLPAAVVLDLKLPYIHGFQVLTWLRLHPQLRELPVVVLTSSPEERDRAKAAELGALAFFVKPPQPAVFAQVAALLREPALART